MNRGHRRNASNAGHGKSPVVLRVLRLLVLAVVTLVTASVGFPARAVAARAHPVLVRPGVDRAAAGHGTLSRASHRWRGAVRAVGARDPVVPAILEDDLDDDEGPARAPVTAPIPVAARDIVLTRKPNWPLRGDPRRDRARVAIGRGLLRGPPAA